MNVDNVDNVESTWRIKLCATAKNGEISYIIAKVPVHPIPQHYTSP